jgi:tRNA A37 threonylcarbamoyladenosine modification protein TsaB
MYLLIDITPREGFNLVCSEPDKAGTFYVDEKFFPWQTDKILLAMKEFVAEQGTEFKKLKGLAMSAGNSFSTTRTASILLNTIGHIHNLPVAFITNEDLVGGANQALRGKKKFMPIAPSYSREPNITMAKKKI